MAKQSSTSKQIEHTNRPYAFEQYDAQWPVKYLEAIRPIKEVFGNELVLLEHVGSTSISELPSKPQIDILATVRDFSLVRRHYDEMQKYGYTVRGDYTNEGEEYFTKDTSDGIREVSLHILPDGHPWATDLLDFRDYLREHPKERDVYASAKQQAHDRYPTDYTNYYKAKLSVVHKLRKRAAKWRGHDL